jgi:hypothetical protein
MQKRLEFVQNMKNLQDGELAFFDTKLLVQTYMKMDTDFLKANEQAKKEAIKRQAKLKKEEEQLGAGDPSMGGIPPGGDSGAPPSDGGESGGEENEAGF